MRVLNDLIDLTTVTVSVTEIKNYVPEQAATYVTRMRRTWETSLGALVRTVQAFSLAAVALVPWLPFPLGLVLLVYAVRRLGRRNRT